MNEGVATGDSNNCQTDDETSTNVHRKWGENRNQNYMRSTRGKCG